jgi:hypothetical protein
MNFLASPRHSYCVSRAEQPRRLFFCFFFGKWRFVIFYVNVSYTGRELESGGGACIQWQSPNSDNAGLNDVHT